MVFIPIRIFFFKYLKNRVFLMYSKSKFQEVAFSNVFEFGWTKIFGIRDHSNIKEISRKSDKYSNTLKVSLEPSTQIFVSTYLIAMPECPIRVGIAFFERIRIRMRENLWYSKSFEYANIFWEHTYNSSNIFWGKQSHVFTIKTSFCYVKKLFWDVL